MDDSDASRQEKSLGLLTTRFVTFLQESAEGILDLKTAAEHLNVRQKRRIYDITNVLEGIGLIEKRSKNSIQWLGAGPGCNTREINEKLAELKNEIKALKRKESEIEQTYRCCRQSVFNLTDDSSNKKFAYIEHSELSELFPDDTIFVIQAPVGTQLQVPIPPHSTHNSNTNSTQINSHNNKSDQINTSSNNSVSLAQVSNASNTNTHAQDKINDANNHEQQQSRRYQVHLKSNNGPINVMLVDDSTNDDEDDDSTTKNTDNQDNSDDRYVPSPLRQLTPPPSAQDFVLGLGPQEGLLELFTD